MRFCSLLSLILIIALTFNSCTQGQDNTRTVHLSPEEFQKKITALPSALIIDVRTSEEYSGGHLQNAKNINWNSEDFEKQISSLDKSAPVLVYCLSGGRSYSAAAHMRSIGFNEVYELKGGIIKWRSAGLTETTDTDSRSGGISLQQFDALLSTDKLVLIDFYAQWCAPCKKMEPYLEELKKEMEDSVSIIRIDTDNNRSLSEGLKIEVLPTLLLYKNKKLVWSATGYIGKEELIKHLKYH